MIPQLLDLGCGAGGATKGYQRAGFRVVGVDIAPQANYCGDEFHQADMLDFLFWHWQEFDAVHVGPPCQLFSGMTNCRPGVAETYPDLIGPVRQLLLPLRIPWVIENVPGAPLRADATLCGQMFGLPLYRHRLFESNIPLVQPVHPAHVIPASKAGHWAARNHHQRRRARLADRASP